MRILIACNGLAAARAVHAFRCYSSSSSIEDDDGDGDGEDRVESVDPDPFSSSCSPRGGSSLELCVLASPEDVRLRSSYLFGVDTIFPAPSGESARNFGNVEFLVDCARRLGVDAVFPGWGHASEDPNLSRRIEETCSWSVVESPHNVSALKPPEGIQSVPSFSEGRSERDIGDDSGSQAPAPACCQFPMRFLGPRSGAMQALGDKVSALLLAQWCGAPVVSWSGDHVQPPPEACELLQKWTGTISETSVSEGSFEISLEVCDDSIQELDDEFLFLKRREKEVASLGEAWSRLLSTDSPCYLEACVSSIETCESECERVGFPCFVKASFGILSFYFSSSSLLPFLLLLAFVFIHILFCCIYIPSLTWHALLFPVYVLILFCRVCMMCTLQKVR